MVTQQLRPYAAKAIIEHQWDTDHLDIYITFRFSMDQTTKPDDEVWLVELDEVPKAVTVSTWNDAYTMHLLVPNIVARPEQVTLEYDGPDPDLRITWQKQWEPWGPIVSTEIPPVRTTRIFSTGPAAQDDVDVSGINVLFIDCSANAITIGAFVGGENGQRLFITKLCAAANDVTLEHNEGTGNQNLFLHKGLDETLSGEYGGWILVCNGSNWYDLSHAKHV